MEQRDLLEWRRHGGRRRGAGRRASGRGRVAHRARLGVRRSVVLVTSRVVAGVGSLRSRRVVPVLEECLRRGCERAGFRVVQYSIQRDHVHYLVEAADARALARGIGGLHTRIARAVNRVMGRRGGVFAGRFHSRCLRTPREVWAGLRYVLGNARKHGLGGARVKSGPIDPASSGRWFAPWARWWCGVVDLPAVAPARSWLLRRGWRRWGDLVPWERPGPGP